MTKNCLADCVKPVVEQLEARQLMSVTVTPLFQDSEGHWTLKLRGDNKNDTVVMTDDPVAAEVRFTRNGGPVETIAYPAASEITTFDIDLKGGNDTITWNTFGDAISPNYVTANRSISLDGDVGNDHISIDIPGGMTAGSDIVVNLDGDSGNDTISSNFGYLRDSTLSIGETDGEGNDTSTINLPTLESTDGFASPNYASAVFLDADTGSGKNTLTVNCHTGVYYDSQVHVDVKGGNSTGTSFDTINLDFSNTIVEGKLFVNVNALSGDDKINTLIDGLYVESFNYPENVSAPVAMFSINGNDGKDTITSNAAVAGMYVDETALVAFTVRGGNGDDKINTNFIGPIDIARGGQMVLILDGQNNNDTINTALFFKDKIGTGGGQVTMQILGGQNTDKVTLIAADASTSGVLFGPGAFGLLLDGQTGTDDVKVQTVDLLVPPLIRNFETSTVLILP